MARQVSSAITNSSWACLAVQHSFLSALWAELCKYSVNQKWHRKLRCLTDVYFTWPSFTVKILLTVGNLNGAASGALWLRGQQVEAQKALSSPWLLTNKIQKQHVLRQFSQGLCGPGSVELGVQAAASTTFHKPGSGWAEEEGWQEGHEQLNKGRVIEKGDCGILLPALP